MIMFEQHQQLFKIILKIAVIIKMGKMNHDNNENNNNHGNIEKKS